MHMGVEFDDHGLIARYEQSGPAITAAVRQAAAVTSAMALADMVGKNGLSKFPAHQPGTPTPSAKGQPPAAITGKLRQSAVEFPIEDIGFGKVRGGVGTTEFYGRWVAKRHPWAKGTRRRILRSKKALAAYQTAIRNALKRG